MRLAILAFVLLSYSTCLSAVDLDANAIAAAFFGPDGISNKGQRYYGEMLSFKDQPTLGETLPRGTNVSIRSLPSSGAWRVFGCTLASAQGAQDWYAYVKYHEGNWKLGAVRTLALMEIPRKLRQELKNKPNRDREEEWTYRNLELMFRSDSQLKEFVTENVAKLNAIVTQTKGGRIDQARMAARKLYVSSVEKTEHGIVKITIGGVVDNSVGFMFVPTAAPVPPMEPSEYIYVERAIGNWFVFKTT